MTLNILNKPEHVNYNGVEYLLIVIDSSNISRIFLQILYYKENGYSNFAFLYSYKNINLPVTRIIEKLKIDYLYKLIKEYDMNFAFINFPMCVFEKDILKPAIKSKYENKMILFNDSNYLALLNDSCGKMMPVVCKDCKFNGECNGVENGYAESFGIKEFTPIQSNDYFYMKNVDKISAFKNPLLKKLATKALDDLRNEDHYMRKRMVFVDSFPNMLTESSKERFVYYIYNRKEDFFKTMDFILNFFDKAFIEDLKPFIVNSNQIVISCSIMGDDVLRKTLYFSMDNFDLKSIEYISKKFNVPLDFTNNPAGIGIDFKNDTISSIKIYYNREKVTINELKQFVCDVILPDKKYFLKFLNSLTKPLNCVWIDYKYKNDKLISKRIDISMQYNIYRLKQLYTLFNIPINYFDDKDIYTLSFEVPVSTDDVEKEKINFYYALN